MSSILDGVFTIWNDTFGIWECVMCISYKNLWKMAEKIANNKSETGDTIWVKGCFIVSHLRFHYIPARRAGTSLCEERPSSEWNKIFYPRETSDRGKTHIQSDLNFFPSGIWWLFSCLQLFDLLLGFLLFLFLTRFFSFFFYFWLDFLFVISYFWLGFLHL